MLDAVARAHAMLRTRPARRIGIGLCTAAALFTLLTIGFTQCHTGLGRFTEVLTYLAVVGLAAGIGGGYAVVPAAVAATVLVGVYLPSPIYDPPAGPSYSYGSPLGLDNIVFLAAAVLVSVLTIAATRRVRYAEPSADVTDAVDHALRVTGEARHWAAVYSTSDGEEFAIHAPYQDRLIAAQQLADGAHGLSCSGCERCRLEVV